MTELVQYQPAEVAQYDPTGGRLVSWADAARAAHQLAQALVKTSFVPQAFKDNVGDATAAILMGDELGFSPLASLRSLYVVHGAPALYSRSMVALAQSRGHEIWTELSTSEKVIVCGRRRGSEHVERSEWTISRATVAGYTYNKKYMTNAQEMLYAKASAEIARKVAADALAGVPYSVEDLELEDAASGSVTTIHRDRPKKAQRQPVEPGPVDEPPLDAEPTEAEIVDEQRTLEEAWAADKAEAAK
jgi:hypothetical protein